jgi:hypothetical protein
MAYTSLSIDGVNTEKKLSIYRSTVRPMCAVQQRQPFHIRLRWGFFFSFFFSVAENADPRYSGRVYSVEYVEIVS